MDTSILLTSGEYYEFGNRTLSRPGEYREVFVSASGCDSIVNLTLEVETGVDGVYALPLVIAPNPILGGETTYVDREWTTDEQRGLVMEVINSVGQVISIESPQVYPIAVGGMDVSGIYLVRIISGTGDIYIGRIIVR